MSVPWNLLTFPVGFSKNSVCMNVSKWITKIVQALPVIGSLNNNYVPTEMKPLPDICVCGHRCQLFMAVPWCMSPIRPQSILLYMCYKIWGEEQVISSMIWFSNAFLWFRIRSFVYRIVLSHWPHPCQDSELFFLNHEYQFRWMFDFHINSILQFNINEIIILIWKYLGTTQCCLQVWVLLAKLMYVHEIPEEAMIDAKTQNFLIRWIPQCVLYMIHSRFCYWWKVAGREPLMQTAFLQESFGHLF